MGTARALLVVGLIVIAFAPVGASHNQFDVIDIPTGTWDHDPFGPLGPVRDAWSRVCHIPDGSAMRPTLCRGLAPNGNVFPGEFCCGFAYNNGAAPTIHVQGYVNVRNADVGGNIWIRERSCMSNLCHHDAATLIETNYAQFGTLVDDASAHLEIHSVDPCLPEEGPVCERGEGGRMVAEALLNDGGHYRDGLSGDHWFVRYILGGTPTTAGFLVDGANEDTYLEIGNETWYYVIGDPSGNDVLQTSAGVVLPVTDGVPLQLGLLQVTRNPAAELGPTAKKWTLENSSGAPFAAQMAIGPTTRTITMTTFGL